MTTRELDMGVGLVDGTEEPRSEVLPLPPDGQTHLRETDRSLCALARPSDRRSPFFVGLAGAFGVGVAYVVFRGLADVASVLIIVGLALFIAIGLNPIIDFLIKRSFSRGMAVAIVSLGFVMAIGAFVLLAVPLITHEVAFPREDQR